jgi:hypothetical protein
MKRTELVYSTKPEIHSKLCELQGRRNRLHTPITSSVKVGKSYEAMIVCESVNQAAKTSLFTGQFKSCRHIGRRKKSLHLPTLRAMQSKLHSK